MLLCLVYVCMSVFTCALSAPSLIILLHIMRVPFKRMGMNLIVTFPKSTRGHRCIRVTTDYSTQYPETGATGGSTRTLKLVGLGGGDEIPPPGRVLRCYWH